jgi:glycerol-3-phosphate acyltransferase PlsX
MIAIDAMGGDFAPHVVVQAAIRVAQKGIKLGLFGDQSILEDILKQTYSQWQTLPITLYHCTQQISMEDEPTWAFSNKKDSSLVQAMQAVAQGTAQAFVSAGNTGACLVSGIVLLKRIRGVLRPAIGEFIPTKGGAVFCLDLGANVDCKPEHLEQFAYMGEAYVRLEKKIERPRIALLSNGAESTKGSKNTLEAYALLQNSTLNFIGNREPSDILHGAADVLVCDGFTGNIMLKALEAMAELVPQWIKSEYKRTWWARWTSFFGAKVMSNFKKNIVQVQKGGALLLGVQKPLVIAHGSSNVDALENAILFARDVVDRALVDRFAHALMDMNIKNVATEHTKSDSVDHV